MKISQVHVRDFKRFTDLTVTNIPQTARLIVLAGPNGSGKSSLFDAMNTWYNQNFSGKGVNWDATYHGRPGLGIAADNLAVTFYDPQPEGDETKKKAIYVRTAYRNDPEFRTNRLTNRPKILDDERINRMIDNETSVSKNYERLVAQGITDLFSEGNAQTTFGQYRSDVLGEVRRSLQTLFPNLELGSIRDPFSQGTFYFTKGQVRGFEYKNLSGGEKAAFDLFLDLAVKSRAYDDTVFCIKPPRLRG